MTYRRLSANAITRDDGAEISRRWLKREPDEDKRCEFVAHGPPAISNTAGSGRSGPAMDGGRHPGPAFCGDLGALLEELHAHGMDATVRPMVGVYETAEEAREAIE